jgi:hypothetical protein
VRTFRSMTSRFVLSSSAWMGSSFASGGGDSEDSTGFSAGASVDCHLCCSRDEMCDIDGYDRGVLDGVKVDNDRAGGEM